jgi:hypothetical protein
MTETIYPYCYKIKETENCPQIKDSRISECLHSFIKYIIVMETSRPSKDMEEIVTNQLVKCLRRYGDLYKKLEIKLYVSPNGQNIILPDQERIQASFNTYLRKIGAKNESSPKQDNETIEMVELYSILLNSKFREIYNKYYVDFFADDKSLKPWNGGKIKQKLKRLTKKKRTK